MRLRMALILLLVLWTGAAAGQSVFRPYDRLTLHCEQDPAINREYRLSKQGTLLLHGVPPLRLVGLSEERAGELITNALGRAGLLESGTVVVRRIGKTTSIITCRGAVRHYFQIPAREEKSLEELLAEAQPTAAADLKSVTITTAEGRVITVDATTMRGVLIQPGDDVFVPLLKRTAQVTLLGALVSPGSVDWTDGLTAAQALEAVGGFHPSADRTHVVLVRASGMALRVSRDDVGRAKMQSGDTLLVPMRSDWPRVVVAGAVGRPGFVEAPRGLTLGHALEAAGGLLPIAAIQDARVLRFGEKGFQRLKLGPEGLETVLLDGDVVDIPAASRASSVSALGRLLGFLRFILP
ncbi:MAG TPA: SLBB domain-containing protein [Fimbriimonadaceae bacterium]|nr:SLBB domain-containing protein [Fimbriimonadaceae bacterium]